MGPHSHEITDMRGYVNILRADRGDCVNKRPKGA